LSWACGCGNLFISSRSLYILNKLLLQKDINFTLNKEEQFVPFLVSVERVANSSLNLSPIETQYLSNVLGLFCANFSVLGKESVLLNPDLIISAIETFLNVGIKTEIMGAAIRVYAAYFSTFEVPTEKMEIILSKLAMLFPIIEVRRYILAIFATIFSKEEKCLKKNSISLQIFIILLPMIYEAFAAFHNISPYAAELTNETIVPYIQVGILVSESYFCQNEKLSEALSRLYEREKTGAKDFLLSVADALCQMPEKIKSAVPYLISMTHTAFHKDEILLQAIFETVEVLIDELKPETQLNYLYDFHQIVQFAILHDSDSATRLIECFVKKAQIFTTVQPSQQQIKKIKIGIELNKWEEIGKNLSDFIRDKVDFGLNIENPIPMIPLTQKAWDKFEKQRKDMFQKLKTFEPFYGRELEFENESKKTEEMKKSDKKKEKTKPKDKEKDREKEKPKQEKIIPKSPNKK